MTGFSIDRLLMFTEVLLQSVDHARKLPSLINRLYCHLNFVLILSYFTEGSINQIRNQSSIILILCICNLLSSFLIVKYAETVWRDKNETCCIFFFIFLSPVSQHLPSIFAINILSLLPRFLSFAFSSLTRRLLPEFYIDN